MRKRKILENLIPRPTQTKGKRRFIAVSEDDYEFITRTSIQTDTTRGRVITALVQYYRIDDDG